ncbi:hypothetical protein ACSWSC_000658 [Vibrio alginolyticus]
MKKFYKASIPVVLTIVLGAIGSGLWQYVLDPALKGSTNLMLELATLGVDKFKNEVYVEISKGYQELASVKTQSLFNLLISLIFISASVALVFGIRTIVDEYEELIEDLESIETGVEREKKASNITEIKNRLLDKRPKYLVKCTYLAVALSGVLAVMLIVSASTDRYTNAAVTHFQQVKRIVAPYITSSESLEIDSKFARINTSEDYTQVMETLYTIAERENLPVSDFDVW